MQELEDALINAVKKEPKDEPIALLFSGGLDSALIGQILTNQNIDVTAITVGTKNSEDVKISQFVAGKIFKKHVTIELTENLVEQTIPDVIKITGKTDAVTVSVGSVIYLAAKYAAMLGFKTVYIGAGSDEIFCGYSSHEKALENGYPAVQKECKLRLKNITKDIERDKKICEHFGLDVQTPFLDKKVVDIGMKISPELKISKDEKKIIIREIAKEMDLPEIVYSRKKKAAQYGSGIQDIIKKLSKKAGFDTILDYLNNLYKK